MRNVSFLVSLFCFAFVLSGVDANAQPPGRMGGGGNSRPGSPGSSSLERAGVKLGQTLPDLTIFDDKGGKFRLADVKGKHTVIVFGCLT